MIANEVVTGRVEPLKKTDTLEDALEAMRSYGVSHMPVVEDDEFLGVIYMADINARKKDNQTVADLEEDLIKAFVSIDQHLYEVVKVIDEFSLSMVPVLDEEEEFQGVILLPDLLHWFSDTVSIKEPGGIVVISVDRRDLSMSQIAQIVEGNDCRILSSFITSYPESPTLDVTLKLDRRDIDGVIQTFERYDYKIKSSFQETMIEDDLKDKFEELMNYINM